MSKHQFIKFLIRHSDKITLGEFEHYVKLSSERDLDFNRYLYNKIKKEKNITDYIGLNIRHLLNYSL